MDTTVPELSSVGAAPASRRPYQVQDVLRLLRRRWKLVASVTLVVGVAGVGLTTLRSPIYAAHATLVAAATAKLKAAAVPLEQE